MYDGNRKKIIILDIMLLLYTIIFQVFVLNKLLKYSYFISAAFMVIMVALTYSLIGFKRDNRTNLKMRIFYKTLTLVVAFFIVTYLLGVFIGFNNNAYSRSPLLLLNNIFAPVFLIASIEIYRYILINSVNEKSKLISFTTISLIIFEIFTSINAAKLFALLSLFKIATTRIVPIISKNIVMTSLCKYGGIRSTLLYRLVMDTYIYLVPIVSNFSDYMISILGICFPFIVYIYTISDLKEDRNKIVLQSFKDDFSIGDSLVLTSIICLTMLLSGFFPLVLIGVGSESMHPKIEKGDAVIYKKIVSDNDIKVGDVLVFDIGDKILIHRLVEKKEKNNVIHYITKGDANNDSDNLDTTLDDIRGVVTLKIKYIAYPTIWFNELINKRS